MNAIGLLIVCLVLGAALRASGRVGPEAGRVVAALLINVSLPAATVLHLRGMRFEPGLLTAIAMPWALFTLSWACFSRLGPRLGWDRATVGALVIVCGVGNTAFVGLPVVQALVGTHGLPVAMALDQLGTWLVLATLGTAVAALATGEAGATTPGAVLRRMAAYPPFLALLLALALHGVALPEAVEQLLQTLAALLAPLALLGTGTQLSWQALRTQRRPLAVGLAFKLLAWPLLVGLALAAGGSLAGNTGRVTLLEAAMGPSVAACALASSRGLNEGLCAALVAVGVPLGILGALLASALAAGGA